ncbi:uncharacterized protein [Mytilus edulis]|uniref:uncharacterized protein isoform X2 n=1 Tax=Mytilus edulis TaxID=6550 RepID=UPI0039EF02A5
MVETLFLFILTIVITSARNDNKVYSEDDVYLTTCPTTYSNMPSDCNLFGSYFEADSSNFKDILNITENGTYWIGAKIGFKRNINPLGVQKVCNGNQSGSLDECNSHCKGWKYFSYNEQHCSCLENITVDDGLAKTKTCKNPDNGLCSINECVVYERNVSDKGYVCDVVLFGYGSWIFTTQNCSTKLNFICEGDKPYVAQVRSSWLAAEHTCSKRDQHLLQPSTKTLGNNIEDGTIYWVSSFRQKKISWGEDFSNTVCVAAKILTNGNYRLESHFCNESLEALCHKPDRTTYGSSKSDIMTASLGTALGGVLVCITVVAVAIKNRRGHLRTNQTHPQEDMNISPASTDEEEDETFSQNQLQLEVSSI